MPSRSNGSPGEAVDIADGAGKRLTGTVGRLTRPSSPWNAPNWSEEHGPDIRLVLVQALAKGDRDELAVETATELGIDAVVPVAVGTLDCALEG